MNDAIVISETAITAEVVPVMKPNRFTGARCSCPRCKKRVDVDKFIVNPNGDGRTLITFACPACTDVVQIFMTGESAANSYTD